jgi:hypothetical protein
VSAQPRTPPTQVPADGATTGGCPYDLPLRCTITRRGGPPCPPNHQRHPRRRCRRGNHRGLLLRFAIALTITRRDRPLCLPLHKCLTQAPPMGQPQGVAPTVCYEPSPAGADPRVRPTANAIRTGTRQWGNHRGLPLRFAMNHHPPGRTPVSAQPPTPPTQPTGQPQGVAPTVCYEPSPVGADPRVRPTANAPMQVPADGATTGGLPLRFGIAQPHARNPAGVAVARRTAPPYPR